MKRILTTIFASIFLVIILLPRLYNLGIQPPGLNIDEVSFTADAKAIVETGRDTWGISWPLIFKAFGEWKAPGLTYSIAFWIKLSGIVNTTISRIPSAIAGLTILVMFGLTLKLLYPKTKLGVLVFSILFLAFSPWHFDMSRVYYESFSALAVFSVSLYFFSKATILKSKNPSIWIIASCLAGLSGYWYASIRIVAIMITIVAVVVQGWNYKLKFKIVLFSLSALLLVGIGWVGDLGSARGLARLNYYQQKSASGAGLEIVEKRQYCYLSFNRDAKKSNWCYILWNKPVQKLSYTAKTYIEYLGANFLFVKGISEYGFDNEYGAFLFPFLPFYLIGLFFVGKGFVRSINHMNNPHDNLFVLYGSAILIALFPASIIGYVDVRMGFVGLYLISILIGVAIIQVYEYIQINLKYWHRSTLAIGFIVITLFYSVQSLVHYFLVFTHSNDAMWTSDTQQVFSYIKSISKEYDLIIDTDLHGPLAPYIYGDITTSDIQNGSRSIPDDLGFINLISAGKYQRRGISVVDIACEKWGNHDNRKMIAISREFPSLSGLSLLTTRTWDGVDIMHEVYDLDKVVAHELDHNSSFRATCTAK